MKNALKRKSIGIGLFFIMLISVAASVAQKQFDRKALKEELKAYFEENIKPVLQEKRAQLEVELSAAEKDQIENIRSQMESDKEKIREMRAKRSSDELSDAELLERREMLKEHRKFMDKAWVIVDNHEGTFDKIMVDLAQNRKTWQEDIHAILEKYKEDMDEIEERRKDGRGNGSDHRGEGRKGGKRFGGRNAGMPHKMMMLEKSDVMFLLWDGESDFFGGRGDRDRANQNILIFPNPGTDNTQIEYAIETAGNVTITIHNKQGELVKSVINEEKQAGTYTQDLDISDLENGLYFYKIISTDGTVTKRFIKK
ncbi:T9SS type A sorting domain-containing protein [Flexithrix dorotheae]|uniref:T9SS type A sorting domain-containing protein n=1 Tax=Flexithrix dorotheae TaxID=70993 RepID=UPI000370A6BB|nr:T9SS type A sorting domain-containing protein [Flexithrix dorotheae]